MSSFKMFSKRLALVLVLYSIAFAPALADDKAPVSIWQNARQIQPDDGQTIRLHRNAFRMVFPLHQGQMARLTGGTGSEPDPLESFGEGRAMAVPYEGFFITWEAFHVLPYEPKESTRWVYLWDPNKHLVYWDVPKFYDNTGSPARELSWDQVPDLRLVFRHGDGTTLRFQIEWID